MWAAIKSTTRAFRQGGYWIYTVALGGKELAEAVKTLRGNSDTAGFANVPPFEANAAYKL